MLAASGSQGGYLARKGGIMPVKGASMDNLSFAESKDTISVGGRPAQPVPESIVTAVKGAHTSGKTIETVLHVDDVKTLLRHLRKAAEQLDMTVRTRVSEPNAAKQVKVMFSAIDRIKRPRQPKPDETTAPAESK